MGNYDGSHLGLHTYKTKELIKTSINMLEHCKLVSNTNTKKVKEYLDGKTINVHGEGNKKIDKAFNYVNGSFIEASSKKSYAKTYVIGNKKSIIIAFRGSGVKHKDGKNNYNGIFHNAIVDLKTSLITNERFKGKVHKGFLADYLGIESELKDAFTEILGQIKGGRNSKDLLKGRTLYITGFSLGAAIATLCAYDIEKTYGIKPNVYLFAQPAAGDHDFTREFESKIDSVFRFAHKKDIVAQIPHSILGNFKASGKKLFVFDSKGKQVNHKNIKMLVKANRVAIGSIFSCKVIIAALVKAAISFGIYHNPSYYKEKMTKLYLNYNNNIDKSSNMLQAAEEQYREAQKHSLHL